MFMDNLLMGRNFLSRLFNIIFMDNLVIGGDFSSRFLNIMFMDNLVMGRSTVEERASNPLDHVAATHRAERENY